MGTTKCTFGTTKCDHVPSRHRFSRIYFGKPPIFVRASQGWRRGGRRDVRIESQFPVGLYVITRNAEHTEEEIGKRYGVVGGGIASSSDFMRRKSLSLFRGLSPSVQK